MSKLRRMMFLQGQRCFFCDRCLPEGEASLEHVVPASEGGPDNHSNVVVCCKTLNNVFGCLSVKEKLRAVLQQNGKFRCPHEVEKTEPKPEPARRPVSANGHRPAFPPAPLPGLTWPEKAP